MAVGKLWKILPFVSVSRTVPVTFISHKLFIHTDCLSDLGDKTARSCDRDGQCPAKKQKKGKSNWISKIYLHKEYFSISCLFKRLVWWDHLMHLFYFILQARTSSTPACCPLKLLCRMQVIYETIYLFFLSNTLQIVEKHLRATDATRYGKFLTPLLKRVYPNRERFWSRAGHL